MRSLKSYIEILRKKGFYTCLREAKKALWPVWFTHSKAAIEQIQAERTSRYLWHQFGKLIATPLQSAEDAATDKIIWICWLQGKDNAPEIVKRCIASVEHYAQDYEIKILTADTLAQYVSLPDYIWQKYKTGKISSAHFSDMLRTALLVQHGGIWLDATVLMTDAMPEFVSREQWFFFQKSHLSTIPHAGSSWCLAAKKGNPVLQRVLDVLIAYWKHSNVLRDYYLFHCILYLVCTRNTQAKECLQTMPYVPNVDVHTLQFALFKDFDETEWQHICSRSTIHKLTWKFNHNEPLNKKGTYYDYILHRLHI